MLRFTRDFCWGAATASYQIEGGHDADGKGESIWDRFSHTPGKIVTGEVGDEACDHYHLYRDDIKLMRDLGMKAYRFSVSWPRVLPGGKGRLNQPGLDFYSRLVDGLLEAGIEPFITLYHWDLPQALQDKGGWANRDTARYFGEYAAGMARRLGDRVGNWITHNEPWVVAFLGNETGVHAPGLTDLATAVQVSHNVLVSHGLGVAALREYCRKGAEVGITLNLSPIVPAADRDEDCEAARRRDGYGNRWFLDPIFRGAYPEDMLALYGDKAPQIEPDDMETIRQPLDFLGVNYYFRNIIAADPDGGFLQARDVKPEGAEYTEMGWEVYPEGLYDLLMRVHNEYAPHKLYVTENGAAMSDRLTADGKVHDDRRIAYLRGHFAQAHRAMQAGANLRGYFVWSLMDNFEWAWGFSKRFGVVYVDYATQQRYIKDSGHWYRQVIADNAIAEE